MPLGRSEIITDQLLGPIDCINIIDRLYMEPALCAAPRGRYTGGWTTRRSYAKANAPFTVSHLEPVVVRILHCQSLPRGLEGYRLAFVAV